MTAKWIDELLILGKLDKKEYIAVAQTLERINKLLSEAAFSTENEDLHDKILSEIKEI